MSKKRIITYIIIIAVIIGSILTGGLFNFIDFIIVRPIVNILYIIYNLVGDFGLAIIIFTIVVKLATWPLMRKQLHQTKLMRKLQPKIAEIKKNCNGNKQMESIQTMDLYKRYNIKPFSSILTLIIQFPIYIALFSSIRVIVTPTISDNLSNRAYEVVAYDGSIIKDIEEKQQAYLSDLANDEIATENKTEYNFQPQLFGTIDLGVKASEVFTDFSWSALFMLFCAISAAFIQYFSTKQQLSSKKDNKRKKFSDILEEAKSGKEIDQNEISAISTASMSKTMPIMMFLIMINLNGALAFYYFLSSAINFIQQRIILKRAERELDDLGDKAIIKELKNIQEAKIIENKKTGTKITRISAKDSKKKRR